MSKAIACYQCLEDDDALGRNMMVQVDKDRNSGK